MVYVLAIIIAISTAIYITILVHYDRRKMVMPKKIPILFPLFSWVLIMMIFICIEGISAAPVIILGLSPLMGIHIAATYSWYLFWRKATLSGGFIAADDTGTVDAAPVIASNDRPPCMGESSFLMRSCVAILVGLGFLFCMIGLGFAATGIFHLKESVFSVFLITGLIGIPVIWLLLLVLWEAQRQKRSKDLEA
jgi:hypothetical protein